MSTRRRSSLFWRPLFTYNPAVMFWFGICEGGEMVRDKPRIVSYPCSRYSRFGVRMRPAGTGPDSSAVVNGCNGSSPHISFERICHDPSLLAGRWFGRAVHAGLAMKSLQEPSATIGPFSTLQPPHLSGAGAIHWAQPSHFFATCIACAVYSEVLRASSSSGLSPEVSSQFGAFEQARSQVAGRTAVEKIASRRRASRRNIVS